MLTSRQQDHIIQFFNGDLCMNAWVETATQI